MTIESVFSPKRFWYLFKKEMLAIYRPMLTVYGAAALLVLIISFFSTAVMKGEGRLHYGFFYFFLFSIGPILSSMAFLPIYKKERNMEYLMIPASTLEKFLVKYLSVTVVFVASLIVFSGATGLVSEGLNMLLLKRHHVLFHPIDKNAALVMLHYLIIQSVFLLGSAYFKRIPYVQTLLVLWLLSFVFMILGFIFLGVIAKTFMESAPMMAGGAQTLLTNPQMIVEFLGPYGKALALILKISYFGVLAPVCALISFLRLREAQVQYGV
jgi:hypothetical protein